MKRILKFLFLFLIGIIIAMILVPFLFKDEIIAEVEKYANEQIEADLSFENVSISLFKAFPNAQVSLKDIQLTGKGAFDGINLFSAKEVNVATNLKSLWSNDQISIKHLALIKPEINLVVNETGSANYDITKPSDGTSQSSSNISLDLQSYEISEGNISYSDASSQLATQLRGFNQEGKGDFSLDAFTLKTQNNIASVTLNSAGTNYLKNAEISGPLDVEVDMKQNKYTLGKNEIKIHDLILDMGGYVQLLNEDMMLDLSINSKGEEITNLLSLLPSAYYKSLPSFASSGKASFNTTIKGKYNGDKNTLPSLDLTMNVANGKFSSTDLPAPITDINLDLSAKAKEGSWDDLSVDLPNFSLSTLGKPFSGKLKVDQVMSDPLVDLDASGALDLNSISKMVSSEEYQIKEGNIEGDIILKGKASDFEAQNLNAVTFDGNMIADNIAFDYGDYKDIKINKSQINFNPKAIGVKQLQGSMGKSDLTMDLDLNNPVNYLLSGKDLEGKVVLRSKVVDLTPYLNEEVSQTATTSGAPQDFTDYSKMFKNFEFDVSADRIEYPDYKITNLNTKGAVKENIITLKPSKTTINDQTVNFNGTIVDALDYSSGLKDLDGKMNVSGGVIDVYQLLGYSENTESTSGEEEALILPSNIQTYITGNFKKIIYDGLEFDNLKGTIEMNDGAAFFRGIQGKVLDGTVKMDGLYDSSDPTKEPAFDMKYDLNGMQWSKSFAAIESFKMLAPVGKFIDGLFNSTLTFSGKLQPNMMPSWNSLSADGFIHTLNGAVKGMLPLEKVGDALGINKLKNFKIEDTKNWFEVKDGFVEVKAFDFDVEDMKFTAGGKHSLEQELDYMIKGVIPKERLTNTSIGSKASQGLDFLTNEASKKGIDLSVGDFIYVDIYLTGKLTDPKVKIIPKGSGGQSVKDVAKAQATKVVETAKDSIKRVMKEKSDAAKDTVLAEVDKQVDKTKEKINEEKDKLVEKGKEKLKEKAGSVIDSAVGGVLADTLAGKINSKVDDVLNGKSQEEIDKLKDKLKGWDPFKKKKGNG